MRTIKGAVRSAVNKTKRNRREGIKNKKEEKVSTAGRDIPNDKWRVARLDSSNKTKRTKQIDYDGAGLLLTLHSMAYD
ncbi:hypothetical protein NPIL_189131 [Nephila pilipes]|uniref:Uncharacterized protein n=1 Tax=Nephila pilipes TaxID=299642 RepID=A0A8X6JXM2_NEPPI|nr:hypothetical protein NPIL_189131 [Nephila pilipes]